WGDELLVVYARDVLTRNPHAVIVSEVKGSQRLYDDIAAHGGKGIMWKAGHSLLKAKMRETGALLGGGMRGHMLLKEFARRSDAGTPEELAEYQRIVEEAVAAARAELGG